MKNLTLGLLGLFTILAFQNCSKSGQSSTTDSADNQISERVVDASQTYTHVVSDPELEFSKTATAGHLEVDTNSGVVISLDASLVSHQCALDEDRLFALRSLLQNATICEPAAVASGDVSCMAYASADIAVSNDQASVDLRPVMCDQGVFLCNGNDALLRTLLADIKSQLPAGCN
jgi:hypothetical protein